MASKTPKQQAIRLNDSELARLQVISGVLTKRAAGTPIGIPTAIRRALELGLPRLEKRLKITTIGTDHENAKK